MRALKLLKNDSTDLPTPKDVSPKFVELNDKASTIAREIEVLRQRQRALADAGDARNAHNREDGVKAAAEARVAKILGRQPVERAPAPNIEKDLRAIASDIKDREAALEVLARDIDMERRAASFIIMQQLEPKYREIISQICESLLQLHEANRRYNAFADHVNFNGINWSGFGGMPPWFLGHPNDTDSNLARYLREAVEAGFMKSADLPPEFR
ncbi:hypothetical protein [Bradyrhizobium yuanmingense]|uniref:hypothetical protein n=1 Tax=Bradyrhizobium yuanmingense TaxID=108015 RepID=UPI0023B95ACD|nr:hypothetical protein [Bradyrhizobium yuanmingense]MDF0581261.1 hypothetical protein [Bradyrhizobium yuanmingense]